MSDPETDMTLRISPYGDGSGYQHEVSYDADGMEGQPGIKIKQFSDSSVYASWDEWDEIVRAADRIRRFTQPTPDNGDSHA